jgi:FtsP/CotA-like multicopper oxidase with cupredoxin domain
MSRNQRLSFLGIAAVIAVVAIVVLTVGGGSDDTATDDSANTSAQQTATATATATAEDGEEESTPTPTATPTPKPQPPLLQAGKVAKLRFKEGDTVRFRVRHDGPEHVHVHGYDIMKDIEAGKTANVAFKATITGIFEVEFEDSAEEIAELRVDPK